MDIKYNKTAVHVEQQLKLEKEIINELQDINKNLKSISDTLLHICQYGIIAKC